MIRRNGAVTGGRSKAKARYRWRPAASCVSPTLRILAPPVLVSAAASACSLPTRWAKGALEHGPQPQAAGNPGLPQDKGPLLYFVDEDSLYNPRLRLRYRITDDIPIMLVDEAETVDDAEHDRLLAKAAAEGIAPTFEAEQ